MSATLPLSQIEWYCLFWRVSQGGRVSNKPKARNQCGNSVITLRLICVIADFYEFMPVRGRTSTACKQGISFLRESFNNPFFY